MVTFIYFLIHITESQKSSESVAVWLYVNTMNVIVFYGVKKTFTAQI